MVIRPWPRVVGMGGRAIVERISSRERKVAWLFWRGVVVSLSFGCGVVVVE